MNKITMLAIIALIPLKTICAENLTFHAIERKEIEKKLEDENLSKEERLLLRLKLRQLPKNSNETPTTAKIIRHGWGKIGLFGRRYNAEDARIFFGTDETGKPCYKTIGEHLENNPDFANIKAIIFHEGSWPFSNDSFEYIGTIGDEEARDKLIKSMTAKPKHILFDIINTLLGQKEIAAAWCPEQNAFIGGKIGNTSVCNQYTQFENQLKQQSKFKKI